MKKIAVAVLASTLLMIFSVVPVMAKTEKVDASLTFRARDDLTVPGKAWFTNGRIYQERGTAMIYEVMDLDLGGSHHTGTWPADFSCTVSEHTWVFLMHVKGAMTLDGNTDNGFAGNLEAKWDLVNNVLTGHCVLQGFGAYKGQTLSLTFDGPGDWPELWTGYCLKG